jgi:hypothetical protein
LPPSLLLESRSGEKSYLQRGKPPARAVPADEEDAEDVLEGFGVRKFGNIMKRLPADFLQ